MDETIYSFSRLSSYRQCPYQYYKKYIENEDGVENFYAQAGSLMHEALENILKKKITIDEAIQFVADNFEDRCWAEIPQSQKDATFEKWMNYLTSIDEHDLDGYSILGVEQLCRFKVGDVEMRGYIDLLMFDKDGNIFLVDHKSASYPIGRNGKVYKNSEATHKLHKIQLYLYSIWVKETYGQYPKFLCWNHFKNQRVLTIPFNENELEEAKQWVLDTVEDIHNDAEFMPQKEHFFCHNLCSYRYGECEYLDEEE